MCFVVFVLFCFFFPSQLHFHGNKIIEYNTVRKHFKSLYIHISTRISRQVHLFCIHTFSAFAEVQYNFKRTEHSDTGEFFVVLGLRVFLWLEQSSWKTILQRKISLGLVMPKIQTKFRP